jgi:GNAT superfamily N-acetyltransferase
VSIAIRAATADRWDDLVAVFGRRGEDPSWCWCQLFLSSATPRPSGSEPAPDNRQSLYREVTQAEIAPGLIAYEMDHPVGWTRVGPRCGFPGVFGNRSLARVLSADDEHVWWVTCFAVDSRYRRSGVGSALLRAAVEFAGEHGATAVEGYPVDATALKAARVAGSALFTGTVAMFASAGFVEVARPTPTRPLMRLTI